MKPKTQGFHYLVNTPSLFTRSTSTNSDGIMTYKTDGTSSTYRSNSHTAVGTTYKVNNIP